MIVITVIAIEVLDLCCYIILYDFCYLNYDCSECTQRTPQLAIEGSVRGILEPGVRKYVRLRHLKPWRRNHLPSSA